MERQWPYENQLGQEEVLRCDVLVLGGGLAGCYAAIAAARAGQSVIVVEKGATARSGAAGSGFDHWEVACTNPCCKISPKEMAEASSMNRIITVMASPITSNAGKDMTGCWTWSVLAAKSGIRKTNSKAPLSGTTKQS